MEQTEMMVPDEQSDEQAQDGQDENASESWYIVQPGDSWASLAERNGTSVEALYALNADAPHFSERSVAVNSIVRVR